MKFTKFTLVIPALIIGGAVSAQNQTYINSSGYISGNMTLSKKAESQPASGSQYFDEKFFPATIDNSKDIVVVRHNAYSDEMEVKINEEIKVLEPVLGQTVSLSAINTTYEYVQFTNKDNVLNQNYLIVISDNPNLKIYKKEQIYLQPEEHPTGGYQKYKAPAYKKKNPEYYIKVKDGKIVYFEPNKSDIIGMFPEKKDEIKEFIKENKISPKDEEDLPKLGAYLSTIL